MLEHQGSQPVSEESILVIQPLQSHVWDPKQDQQNNYLAEH